MPKYNNSGKPWYYTYEYNVKAVQSSLLNEEINEVSEPFLPAHISIQLHFIRQ